MEPANNQHKRRGEFRKHVSYITKDDQEQIATGVVMTPLKVDLQGDYATPETISDFANQFENLIEAGEADGGVMHAAWPSEWMTLEENRITQEQETIGGTEVSAGAWVQSWKYTDDELWSLVDDGILGGHSIGAVDVEWRGPMEQDELPDEVSVPEEFDEEDLVWELVDGLIREVSAVDIPAVPDAQILETKDAYVKRLADHLGNRDGFVEEAMSRGHSESEAERLWAVLNRAIDMEGAGNPGKESGVLQRAGKAFLNTLTGTDDANSGAENQTRKEGQTLNARNKNRAKAIFDTAVELLDEGGVAHDSVRFTDRDEDSFDLTEFSASEISVGEEEEEEGGGTQPDGFTEQATEQPDNNETMTNNKDDAWDDAPEWAKSLRDDVEQHSDQIDDLKDDEKDGEGEGEEVWEDAPEWALDLKESVESNSVAIETIGKQSGFSDQLDSNGENKENHDDDVAAFKAGLIGKQASGD